MTIGKPLKLSSIWDVVGLSSLIRLEVMEEWIEVLGGERQKMRQLERVFWFIVQMKKNWHSLIEFEIT